MPKNRPASQETLDRVAKMEQLTDDIKDLSKFALRDGETIVTAFAEKAAGPGWYNAPVRVVIRNRVGVLNGSFAME